ncbi:hypothetical protein QFW96_06655 [Saccharopolyspora sp. TS4A08]|uniref:DUF3093 domain-containing protein n=1 Tax=Saccharopolyspora ipomoeae TaxID=3042027 RepID=A0ABT6PJX0_9PSEU|nr:hypothetical protein [Saccharopolyspora sp. TS4A08]MDI2028281.1 hypothetical protein [Saccharopolyspora sp. TS4A08]
MDFHKNRINLIPPLILIALGVLGTVMLVGGLTSDEGVRIHGIFFVAPIGVIAGLVLLIKNLRRLTMRIDERGILIEHPAERVKVALGWQYVAGVSVTTLRKRRDDRNTATYLVVWTQGGLNPGVPQDWMFQNDGWTGYRLIDTSDLRESDEQLTQALGRYAAPVLR